MTAVLGVHLGPAHDTGAALVYEDAGELRAVAIAEARLSRRKHSRAFPGRAIEVCLNEVGIRPSELSAIVIEKNLIDRSVRGIQRVAPDEAWLNDPSERAFFARTGSVPVYEANHHLAHAATCWHTTRWPEDGEPGALLVIDGRGSMWEPRVTDDGPALHTFPRNDDLHTRERDPNDRRIVRIASRGETQSVFRAQGRSIAREAVSLRSGVGFFYVWVTQMILGFAHMHSGKSMGLAAYGDADLERFPRMPDDLFDGIDTDFISYIRERFDGGLAFPMRGDQPPTDPYFAGAAEWAQRELTRAVEHLSRFALGATGARRLGYAGGVALNVVANRHVRDTLESDGLLDDMFVQPAASDEGLALGCALLGYYDVLRGVLPFQRDQVFLGPSASARHATEDLVRVGGARTSSLPARVADLLLDGKIVGWVQWRSEHGPRALGARSILCWPRPDWMKDHLNARVKHREAFRPFAPIVHEAHAHDVFDIDRPSPHMLFNAMVRPAYRDRLPAITHADGSARLQTVSERDNPPLASLLREVRARDGVGVLLNTSFNDNNEPIVETVSDALDCFKRTGLDALICGDAILRAEPPG
ncbi:MAG: carbamoyltransferase C-terminal domain-containing protein [Planctomycetota bacterium]